MKNRQEIKKASKKMTRSFMISLLFSSMVFGIFFLTVIIIGGLMIFFLNMGLIFEEYNNPTTLTILVVIFAFASIVLGTIISFAISHIPLKPVLELVDGLNKLEQGDYKTRIDLGKSSMMAELTDNFKTLASELENTEMLRTDFVNNFSHEFKTPIVSIRGFARLLQKGNLTKEQEQEYLSIIEEEASRLSDMATNVLNLTKIENQDILTDVTDYNLSEQIRNCILLVEKKWSDKKLEMVLDFDEINIQGNEEMLKQVWINLLDNAIKFSPVGNKVVVEIDDENDEDITVSIKNFGPAIKKEDLPMIMNKFFQGDRSHSKDGNGIGLAIVDRIVKLHNGSVTCESDDEKTVFYVKLPRVYF